MIARRHSDGPLKDILQRDPTILIRRLTRGREVVEFLNVELPAMQQRRVDLAMLLADGSILHVEFQSRNDPRMARRMAMYHLLLSERLERPLRQVVLYVGAARMCMPRELNVGLMRFRYELLDIRSIDVSEFLASGHPADCALAILAGNARERFDDIMRQIRRMPAEHLPRASAQLLLLSGLRKLSHRVKMEFRTMPIEIDISKNVMLQDILEQGRAEGRAEGARLLLLRLLEKRFGAVPKAVRGRVASSSLEELETLNVKAASAASLNDVFAPRDRVRRR